MIFILSIFNLEIYADQGLIHELCDEIVLEKIMLRATCKVDGISKKLSINLNKCFGAKNGILQYPGTRMSDYCKKCFIQNKWELNCYCIPTRLSLNSRDDNWVPTRDGYDPNYDYMFFNSDSSGTPPLNWTLSYITLKDKVRLDDNGRLQCL